MGFIFLHTADLHIDSPMRGLASYEGAPVEELRGATRSACRTLVDEALERKVDFLLISGDIYDGDWKDHNTGLFFAGQMERLRKGGVPVYMITGNHDATHHMTRNLSLPDNVRVFPTNRSSTERLDGLGVAVHGRSYGVRAQPEDLTEDFPPPEPGFFNIGLLHTSLNGREDHDVYAPTSPEAISAKGYQYWALGHIHKREVVSRNPWIVYPGNPQGRHVRETGPRGCMLVAVEDGEVSLSFLPLDEAARWALLDLDCSGLARMDDVLAAAAEALEEASDQADGRLLAARLELSGCTPVHPDLCGRYDELQAELRRRANALGGVWLEKVKVRTEPPPQDPQGRDDAARAIRLQIEELRANPERFTALAEPILKGLPGPLRHETNLVGPEELKEALDRAEGMLVHLLATRQPS